ncbi:MAG: NUDIX hydrolase [Lactobacillales bacterium]|nr:NUDIX hydrolase [Lactobacillales bacterium]
MSKRQPLLKALKEHKTSYPEEKDFVRQVIDFVEKTPGCFERSHRAGHITGSAWVINPDGQKTLLTHHKKLNKWLQLGGHSDGDPDTWHVAMREVLEESGITDVHFMGRDIFDVDVHEIPENPKKGEPAHLHYDIRFLIQANNENFVVSDESNALRWVSKDEIEHLSPDFSTGMKRLIDKWKKS